MQKQLEIFMETGPMITQAQAARLLHLSRARISQMIQEKKLEEKEILSVKMITIRSVIKLLPNSPDRSDVATEN